MNWTDYAENKIADFFRAQGLTLPANWRIAAATAASESGVTEITGAGLARGTIPRSLTDWNSTQGDSLASTGTSKTTANSADCSLGTATGSGTITHLGLMDAGSGGNCWATIELETPVDFVAGAVSIPTGALSFKLGRLGGATYKLVNKFIDLFFRAQAFTWPTTIGLAYFTTAPTDAGGGVEASGGSYARIAITPSLTSILSTQGDTSASSGTGGVISNPIAWEHPEPSADQGSVVETGVFSAATAGDLYWHKPLPAPITVRASGPRPTYAPGAWTVTIA